MSKQRALGLDRPITRRDFIQGVAVPVGASLVVPGWVQSLHAAQSVAPEQADDYYPPSQQLPEDVGIDLDRFLSNNTDSRQMYRRMGLGGGYFFDKETWGADRLVKGGGGRGGRGYDEAHRAIQEVIQRRAMPVVAQPTAPRRSNNQ